MGVHLSRDLMAIAGGSLKANITTLGPLVLPYSEQLLFFFNLCVNLFVTKVGGVVLSGGWGAVLWPQQRSACVSLHVCVVSISQQAPSITLLPPCRCWGGRSGGRTSPTLSSLLSTSASTQVCTQEVIACASTRLARLQAQYSAASSADNAQP